MADAWTIIGGLGTLFGCGWAIYERIERKRSEANARQREQAVEFIVSFGDGHLAALQKQFNVPGKLESKSQQPQKIRSVTAQIRTKSVQGAKRPIPKEVGWDFMYTKTSMSQAVELGDIESFTLHLDVFWDWETVDSWIRPFAHLVIVTHLGTKRIPIDDEVLKWQALCLKYQKEYEAKEAAEKAEADRRRGRR